ncbi:acetyl-CoA-benzylalcohol acetyltransferase-like [Fagus crenata]
MKVEIVSRKLIKPATPTPPHLRSLKPSSIDQLQLPIYGAFICYYHANVDENSQRSKRLEKSLSEILTLYYPIAGRYIKDKQMIVCNDEGVEYLQARVSGKLAQLIQRDQVKVEVLTHLTPHIAMPSTSTPLAFVQVNMFECGGLAIALLISHILADGIAACTFLNAWATACRGAGVNEVIRPRFDLTSFFPPRQNIPAAVQPKKPGALIITERFVFDGALISRLKAIACESALTKRQPSRVVVVTAFIWKVLIAIAQAKHGHLKPSILCHSLSLRGKTALPIPDNSFGNLYMVTNARFGGDNESKIELHDLVGLLDDSIRNALADCRKPQNGDDLVSLMTNSLREVHEEREGGETDIYMFTSWCRFPLYEADFGFGKPILVSSRPKPVEMVSLNDIKDDDGIEAWVSLDERDMLLFQNHPEIKPFTSQI